MFVLGAGRAGRGLAAALRNALVEVTALHGRRPEPDAEHPVTAGDVSPYLANADVALIAVRDSQLDAAVEELLAAHPPSGLVMLHASGGVEPAAYREARRGGHPCGTFHPLLPLADPGEAARLFRGAWVGIDGDPAARGASKALAKALGARTLDIPANRALYHVGAVLASNFLGVLASVAARAMGEAGVEEESAVSASRSLLLAAADNLRVRQAAEVITGPIARGDEATVKAHLEAVAPHSDLDRVYRTLSRQALALARERGVPDEKLANIARLLGDASSDDPQAP